MEENTIEKGTPERILAAAAQVFAESGYEGARVDEIARQAGVNKAALYYHIGGKQVLYAQVLNRLLGEAASRTVQTMRDKDDPEEQLRIYIRNIAKNIDQQPHLPPIMLREIASGGKHIPEELVKHMADMVAMLAAVISKGAAQGKFIAAQPFIVHIMIITSIIFHKSSRAVRMRFNVFPEEIRNQDADVSGPVADEIERLIFRALKK